MRLIDEISECCQRRNREELSMSPCQYATIISQSTQDVMYRRKIIMDGLMKGGEARVSKMDSMLCNAEEEICSRRGALTPEFNYRDRCVSAAKSAPTNSKPSSFSPHWENYDIMKHRWSYLLPQTKNLSAGNNYVVPKSSDSTVVSFARGNTKVYLNGRYSDVEKYDTVLDSRDKDPFIRS